MLKCWKIPLLRNSQFLTSMSIFKYWIIESFIFKIWCPHKKAFLSYQLDMASVQPTCTWKQPTILVAGCVLCTYTSHNQWKSDLGYYWALGVGDELYPPVADWKWVDWNGLQDFSTLPLRVWGLDSLCKTFVDLHGMFSVMTHWGILLFPGLYLLVASLQFLLILHWIALATCYDRKNLLEQIEQHLFPLVTPLSFWSYRMKNLNILMYVYVSFQEFLFLIFAISKFCSSTEIQPAKSLCVWIYVILYLFSANLLTEKMILEELIKFYLFFFAPI